MLIDVTIDIRDLDSSGAAPAHAAVRFARLIPANDDGTLVTAAPVPVALTDGHGTVQLETETAYRVLCTGIAGIPGSFTILTAAAATTLADLWQTGQIDPTDYTTLPVPEPLDDALAAIRADIAALQAGGGGGGGGLVVTPTGDGYLELSGGGVTPTGDGYLALN